MHGPNVLTKSRMRSRYTVSLILCNASMHLSSGKAYSRAVLAAAKATLLHAWATAVQSKTKRSK